MGQVVTLPGMGVAQAETACATNPVEGYVVRVEADPSRRSPSLLLDGVYASAEAALAGVAFAKAWYSVARGFDPRRISIRRVEPVIRTPARPTWAVLEEVFRAV